MIVGEKEIATNLFEKYNVPCPRYTSYPSIPYWTGSTQDSWKKALQRDLEASPQNISLYLHVPFCKTPCAFCGCTKIITRDRKWADVYKKALIKEAQQKAKDLGESCEVSEIHIGGGTPTWLEPQEIEYIFEELFKVFKKSSKNFSFSIEFDPRTLSEEHVKSFKKVGINRVSIGVQDFHEPTMKAIARIQSYELVSKCMNWLRSEGFENINFDLVYGLPEQTPASIQDTILKLIHLNPTRVAFYSYAHVPTLKPAQKYLEKSFLPTGQEKHNLFEVGKKLMLEAGYEQIGIDHFAKSNDELSIAQRNNQLHRNFMGYTTTDNNVLIGLGPSSVSSSLSAFSQNEKDPQSWSDKIENSENLIVHGHLLSEDDKQRQSLIKAIMCVDEINIPSTLLNEETQKKLNDFEKDNLIETCLDAGKIKILPLGKDFRRNIAAIFDSYLINKQNKLHSKS